MSKNHLNPLIYIYCSLIDHFDFYTDTMKEASFIDLMPLFLSSVENNFLTFIIYITVEKALQSLDDPREAVLALGLLRGLLQRWEENTVLFVCNTLKYIVKSLLAFIFLNFSTGWLALKIGTAYFIRNPFWWPYVVIVTTVWNPAPTQKWFKLVLAFCLPYPKVHKAVKDYWLSTCRKWYVFFSKRI